MSQTTNRPWINCCDTFSSHARQIVSACATSRLVVPHVIMILWQGSLSLHVERVLPWAENTKKERGKSAAEQSLDLLKGTSTTLVDSGDEVWLSRDWNTLSSILGTVSHVCMEKLFLYLYRKPCHCVCVCVCALPWGAVCVLLPHSRPVSKCSQRRSATPPVPSDLRQTSATWSCNPASALMCKQAHTRMLWFLWKCVLRNSQYLCNHLDINGEY